MKLINNFGSILNNKRIFPRNNSFISSSEYSVNNASSTTKASKINNKYNFNLLPKLSPKRNYILKKIKINNFKKSSSLGNLNNFFISSTVSSKSNKKTIELLDNAEQIMRERMKNHGVVIAGGKFLLKSIALKESKEVSKKNYTINLLKEERTQINEKERIINKALKEFESQYESDHKKFMYFVEEEKRKQKLEEETMNYIKEKLEKKRELLNQESLLNKRLEETLERKIKEIYLLKSYGSFLNKIFDKYFIYNDTLQIDSREKNYEKISNKIIEIYEKNKKNDLSENLENEELLMNKYKLLEDKIMLSIKNKEILDKEILRQKKGYEKELNQLKLNLLEYENDYNYVKNERNIVHLEMKNFRYSENELLEYILEKIIELGNEIGTESNIPEYIDKNDITDFVLYSKKTIETLRNKELLINKRISEIENYLFYGNDEDKILMEKSIKEQKNINKKENQLKAKQYKEDLKNQMNLRAIERSKKMVIKGRKVNYSNFKNKHKIKKIIHKIKEDKYGYIYYPTDTEDNQ